MSDVIKTIRHDFAIQQDLKSTLIGLILRELEKDRGKVITVNLSRLATILSGLQPKHATAAMEIIAGYSRCNPAPIKVMTSKGGLPYGGVYIPSENTSKLDLQKLPNAVILMLDRFAKRLG